MVTIAGEGRIKPCPCCGGEEYLLRDWNSVERALPIERQEIIMNGYCKESEMYMFYFGYFENGKWIVDKDKSIDEVSHWLYL